MNQAADSDDIRIRDAVRRRYAAAAALATAGETDRERAVESSACCGDTPSGITDEEGRVVFGAEMYDPEMADGATEAALGASLGCGVPTAVAALHPGETVLDLGSGAGADVLISARRVGPAGKAIGLDMTHRDARAGTGERGGGRRRQRRVSPGLPGGHPPCPTSASTWSSPTA